MYFYGIFIFIFPFSHIQMHVCRVYILEFFAFLVKKTSGILFFGPSFFYILFFYIYIYIRVCWITVLPRKAFAMRCFSPI